jgi:RNA polymerase sigma-70 factor (ECF subfamily)
VYRTRSKYHPSAKFSTWLYTIANNLASNARRDRHRRPAVRLEASESGAFPTDAGIADGRGPSPSAGLAHRELADIIRAALEELNDRQRVAVVLNKFEDMGYAEIAEVMGLTTKAVKSLLSRARARLRDILQPYICMDGEAVPQVADHEEDDA